MYTEAVENGTLQATADGFTAVLACPVCTARAVCNTLASPEWFYDDWFSRVPTPILYIMAVCAFPLLKTVPQADGISCCFPPRRPANQ